jgi:hypothetical protein
LPELTLGNQQAVEVKANERANALLSELLTEMAKGPDSTQRFLAGQAGRRQAANEALRSKAALAVAAGQDKAVFWGNLIKGAAIFEFASTTTLKVASIFAPGVGAAAVDIGYDTLKARIRAKSGSRAQVVVAKVSEGTVKELAETANKMAADKLLTPQELRLTKDWFARYKGDRAKLLEKSEWLANRLKDELAKGAKGAKLVKRYRLEIMELPVRSQVMNSTAAKGASKKAAGAVLSVVFVAQDIREAWGDLVITWNSAN